MKISLLNWKSTVKLFVDPVIKCKNIRNLNDFLYIIITL